MIPCAQASETPFLSQGIAEEQSVQFNLKMFYFWHYVCCLCGSFQFTRKEQHFL